MHLNVQVMVKYYITCVSDGPQHGVLPVIMEDMIALWANVIYTIPFISIDCAVDILQFFWGYTNGWLRHSYDTNTV